MILTFRSVKVRPDDWKPAWARRVSAPFDGSYQRTLTDLDREIRHLEGSDPFLQLDVTDADVRLDGQLRSSARPNHPGVILTFDTKKHGALTYGTDRYDHWHGNLRAIALGLDCLRRVERYGIAERGQQYAGYREIGTGGIELGRAPMTVDQAAAFICEHQEGRGEPGAVDFAPGHLIQNSDHAAVAFRGAAKKLHPDTGGDPELFKRLLEARDVLETWHG